MASRNSRTNRKEARSSRAPQSARAVRSAKAAQSGRIAPYSQASAFSRDAYGDGPSYRAAYTPGSQGSGANGAYARQTAASQYSRNNPSYSAARKKAGRGKKIALGVIIAILVVAVGGGSAFALWKNSVNEKLIKGNKSDEEIMAINDALKPEKDMTFTEPFYMILIGTDEAEDSTEDMHRSDTNIVVRIDPAKNQATMVSIPRDTKIDIDGYGTNKFNAAYAYGGAAGTIREANQLLGIEISHYAEVNFGKLKELVDAVGGVDVEVTERVDDPDADGTTAHPEWPRVIIEEGEQHLDGNQALVFARSRAYPDGDFTRTANQRKLIMAIVNKVLALNTAELLGAVQAAANCVTTDLAVGDIAALAQQFQDDGDLTIYSAMVPSTTAMIGDVSYVINDPVATKEMMKLVRTPARLSRQDTLIRATPQAVPARTATVTAALVRAPATAQETPIITIRATPMHREPEGPTTAAMLTTVTLITVTLTTPAERVEPAGTTTELLLAVRAVPTVQADTTPAIPIRAPTTGRHPLLSRRLVGILELRKRHRLRSMPLFNRLLNR